MPSWAIYGNERRGGIHLVPEGVNLLTQPSAFDHADWTKENCTVDDNAATDPDSTTLADNIIENSDTNQYHLVSQSVTKAASAITYNFSVCAKLPAGDSRKRILLQVDEGGSHGRSTAFDVQNGLEDGSSVGGFGSTFTGGTKNIVDLTNGWWRCEFDGITTGTETTVRVLIALEVGTGTDVADAQYNGDGVSGMYLYEAILVEA
jgi:hypothetical protein